MHPPFACTLYFTDGPTRRSCSPFRSTIHRTIFRDFTCQAALRSDPSCRFLALSRRSTSPPSPSSLVFIHRKYHATSWCSKLICGYVRSRNSRRPALDAHSRPALDARSGTTLDALYLTHSLPFLRHVAMSFSWPRPAAAPRPTDACPQLKRRTTTASICCHCALLQLSARPATHLSSLFPSPGLPARRQPHSRRRARRCQV